MASVSSSVEGNVDISPRISIDSVNLNDDLAADAGSEISSSSASVIHHNNHSNSANNKRKSGSIASFRNSIDAESPFLSSAYFFANSPNNLRQQLLQQYARDQSVKNAHHPHHQHLQNQAQYQQLDSLSPLGPNSIYKLTVASDLARKQMSRSPKSHVTINGGQTTVYNLNSPTVSAIPQIQLLSLKTRVPNDELRRKYVDGGLEAEFKKFESQDSKLTEGTLQKLQQQQLHEQNDNRGASRSGDADVDHPHYLEYAALSSIPPIFSDPLFRLDDPRTFKKVIENSKIISTNDDDAGLNPLDYLVNNTQLQEKLSHYLDLVEISLVEEISKSSSSFFNTIDEIQEIETQSELCMTQFESITNQLESIETEECMKGLNILNKIKLRKNVDKLESALLVIQEILGLFEICQKLLQDCQYTACLELILKLNELISENGMSRLPALFDLQNDLHKLKVRCTSEYIKEFVNELIKDLHSHYQSIPVQDSLTRMSGKKSGSTTTGVNNYQVVDEARKDILREYVINLANSGMLGQAYEAYQERIVNEVKEIIKVNLPKRDSGTPSRSNSVPPPPPSEASAPGVGAALPQSLQDSLLESKRSPEPPTGSTLMVPSSSTNGTAATLSTNLKSMSSTEFLQMLTRTFTNLSECLRRLTTHQKILLDLALTSIPSSENIDVMTFDITLSINKAIEITQIRLAKVINVRLELIADLPVEQYLRVYAISLAYLQECELINPGFISSEGGNSLNDWLRNHVNYFIHRLHLNSLKALIQDCDRETWKEVTLEETLKACQSMVNELVTYAEYVESRGKSGYSGDQWIETMDLQKKEEDIKAQHELIVANTHVLPENRLRIGTKQFLIPSFLLKVLRSTKDYIILSKIFPSRSATIENDLLNYFKLMNSRTSQAILGAGATRTAGLKHIFPKHMALCIQLIGFSTELLENIQGIFRHDNNTNSHNSGSNGQQGSGTNGATDDLTFTRIISNYKDHENELFGKLISMMYDRTVNHCNTVKTIDWSEPIKPPHQCHQYMETLVKDTTTITKVLLKYLPEIQCQLILLQVFDNYKKLFVECYCTQLPQFKDFNEKHSLLKDIDYFRVKLGEVPGYGNSGQVIWENINSMPTIEDSKMEEIMRKNIEKERGIEERKSTESARKSIEPVRSNNKDDAIQSEIKLESDEVLFDVSTDMDTSKQEDGFEVKEPVEPLKETEKKESENEHKKPETEISASVSGNADSHEEKKEQTQGEEHQQAEKEFPMEKSISVDNNAEGNKDSTKEKKSTDTVNTTNAADVEPSSVEAKVDVPIVSEAELKLDTDTVKTTVEEEAAEVQNDISEKPEEEEKKPQAQGETTEEPSVDEGTTIETPPKEEEVIGVEIAATATTPPMDEEVAPDGAKGNTLVKEELISPASTGEESEKNGKAAADFKVEEAKVEVDSSVDKDANTSEVAKVEPEGDSAREDVEAKEDKEVELDQEKPDEDAKIEGGSKESNQSDPKEENAGSTDSVAKKQPKKKKKSKKRK